MLFSGEDVFKKVSVLSGGEKARCMLSKMIDVYKRQAFYLQPFPLLQQLLFPPQMKKIIIITMMIAQIHPEPKPSLFP